MANQNVDHLAKVVWDYLHLNQAPVKADVILTLGSRDIRVAERAAELYRQGLSDLLVFAGSTGRMTKDLFKESEARVFADVAIAAGVPEDKIILEDRSTNTGENISMSYELLKNKNLLPRSLILVQKPYMERRTYATFKKQWPDKGTAITVTSPQIDYDGYFNEVNTKDFVINVMVGDLQRIKEYPKLGFQIEQAIPPSVWQAAESLIKLGYDKQLIK